MDVLIVKLSSMGDVICTLPAVTDAYQAIAGINFTWVVEESLLEIPYWHPAIRTVIPTSLRTLKHKPWDGRSWHEMFSCWQELRAKKYDYILDAQGLLKSALVARIATGVQCGFDVTSAREPLAAYCYKRCFNLSKKMHAVERIRQLFAQSLGYSVIVGNPNYGLQRETFCRTPNAPQNKYLVFIHGTSRANKCWQEEKWMMLAHLAQEERLQVKIPWGNPIERARAHRIAQAANNVEVLPQLSLTAMGEVLMHATCVVALDTGFSHLAAACGVPTITLYGPTKPQLGGTYGEKQHHLTQMANIDTKTVWQNIQLISN